MIKRRQKVVVVFFLVFIVASFFGMRTQLSANEYTQVFVKEEEKKDDTGKEPGKDKQDEKKQTEILKDSCAIYGKGSDDYKQCKDDRKATTSTPKFLSEAIKSLNPTVKAKEAKEDYVVLFANSMQTAIAYDMDFLDPQTVLMHIVGIVIALIEMVGAVITMVVMVIFNASSATFWSETMRSVFDAIGDVIFDWDNPNSFFMKMIIFFILFAIVKKMLTQFKHIYGIGGVLKIIGSCLLSGVIVMGVARYGNPIMDHVETISTDFLTTGVNGMLKFDESLDDSDEYEIQTKRRIFEILQLQGFRLRHFGVTDVKDINAPTKDYDSDLMESWFGSTDGDQDEAQKMWEEDPGSQSAYRYRVLLEDPSKDHAQDERKIFGSTDIIYNAPKSFVVTILSAIFLVHRILVALVIVIGCLIVYAISLLKEILKFVSVFGLVRVFFAPDKKSAFSWFINRFIWMLLSQFSKVFLSVIIFMIISVINTLGSQSLGLLVMLPFDLIIFACMYFGMKNAPRLLQKVLATFGGDGSGLVNTTGRFLLGDLTPSQMLANAKQEFGRKPNKELGNDEDGDCDDDEEDEDGKTSLDKVGDADTDEAPETEADGEGEDVQSDESNDATALQTDSDSEAGEGDVTDPSTFDVNKEFEASMKEKESNQEQEDATSLQHLQNETDDYGRDDDHTENSSNMDSYDGNEPESNQKENSKSRSQKNHIEPMVKSSSPASPDVKKRDTFELDKLWDDMEQNQEQEDDEEPY